MTDEDKIFVRFLGKTFTVKLLSVLSVCQTPCLVWSAGVLVHTCSAAEAKLTIQPLDMIGIDLGSRKI